MTTNIIKILLFFIVAYSLVFSCFADIACANPVSEPSYSNPGFSEQAPSNQQQDIMGQIARKYQQKTFDWGVELARYALILFGAFLTIDIILFATKTGIKMASGGEVSLAAFAGELLVMVILPAAFMFTVIQYHQTWSQQIVNGFLFIAKDVDPSSRVFSGSFFIMGLELFNLTLDAVRGTDPSTWFLLIAGFIILLCYILMALQVLLINCESYIVLSAGVIMLGFGAFSMTRHYAVNFIQYTISVSIKLFVLQLMTGLAFSFVRDFMKTTTSMSDIGTVIGGSVVLLGLIRCIPDICSGIISGQHVSNGNALAGAFSSVGAGAMALAQSGSAAVSLPSALKNAGSAAMEAGGGNPVRTAGSFLKDLAGATTDAAGITGEGASNSSVGRFNSKLNERALRDKK